MTTQKQIRDFGRRLAREFKPRKVILFGSYAYGSPRPDSDVDVLVVMPLDGNPVDKSVEMRLKLRPRFPLDLLVRTPAKIRERIEMGDDFIRGILDRGRVLYEAPDR
jgi:predicted nucleotidyltransferase